MSEYQYYEFQAIDRPLTEDEMRKLRAYSTRALITPTSFVNDYAWGNFKGDDDAWMDKYFDAFLYLANWGTRVFKLRLPSPLLDLKTAQTYCGGRSASARENNGKVILNFISNDEEGGEWIQGEGQLSSLISIRAELARCDLRALYLGWLLCAQGDELDDEDIEPPVPAGLGQLSGSLENMVEFLRIDPDLLDVAAEASQPIANAGLKYEEILAWLGMLPVGEKDDLLAKIISGGSYEASAELLGRFFKERRAQEGAATGENTRRTVGELLRAAEARTAARLRLAAEKRAEEKARKEREAAIARAKYLDEIAGQQPKLWGEVESLIATKLPKSYDQAVALLLDLRDLAAREAKVGAYDFRIEAIRMAHARKPSFIERLRKVGL